MQEFLMGARKKKQKEASGKCVYLKGEKRKEKLRDAAKESRESAPHEGQKAEGKSAPHDFEKRLENQPTFSILANMKEKK